MHYLTFYLFWIPYGNVKVTYYLLSKILDYLFILELGGTSSFFFYCDLTLLAFGSYVWLLDPIWCI